MYRSRRKKREHIIQNIIWWHPIALVFLMFMLGACTKSTGRAYTMPASSAVVADAELSREVTGAAEETQAQSAETEEAAGETDIDALGNYTSKEEVALYLHTYGKLPSNYITKQQAEKQGWNSEKGNLGDILPGRIIGGSFFGNYEGQLPEKSGRKYYECDIDYRSGYRNAKRIVYSNDGLIFYTEDHYKTFEQLY